MANKKDNRRFTKYYRDITQTRAWKATSPGARLLYLELQFLFIENNNGKIYLSTRDAAEKLGISQRTVYGYYHELEHYRFIVATQPGTIGPDGKPALWRLTDHGGGWLDGNPIKATKDYLKWDGILFEKPGTKRKRANGKTVSLKKKFRHPEEETSSLPKKKLRHPDQKNPVFSDEETSSYLDNLSISYPSVAGLEAEAEGGTAPAEFGIGHNAGPPLEDDDLAIPPQFRRGYADAACAGCRPAEIDWQAIAAASLDIPTFLLRGHPDCVLGDS